MGKEHKVESNLEVTVDVLLVEYNNIHTRVFRQIDLYESTNIKILMLMGVLTYFGITNFEASGYLRFFINLIFVGLLPFVAIVSVALTAADLIKNNDIRRLS